MADNINIKKSHKGLLTKKAKSHNMGVQEFASYVLSHKEDFSLSTKKQAQFAKNAKKFKHQEGGTINLTDSKGKNKWTVNKDDINKIVNLAIKNGYSPERALAVALQETGIKNDGADDYFHSIDAPISGSTGSNAEDAILLLKERAAQAKKMGYNTPEYELQMYNGLGKIFPNSDKGVHGFDMRKIYGVPIPKGGLDMKKNPLYGKRILDYENNIIKKDPYIQSIISYYNSPTINFQRDLQNRGLGNIIMNKKQEGGTIDPVKDFYINYLNSPKYTERLKLQGYKDPKKTINDRLVNLKITPETRYTDIPSAYTMDNISEVGFVNINPNELKKYKFNQENARVHEYSHVVGSLGLGQNRLRDGTYGFIKTKNGLNNEEIKWLERNNKAEKNLHDEFASESKADMDTYRYLLNKNKIYNTGTEDFLQRHLDESRKKLGKDKNVKRFLDRYDDKQIIFLMNSIANNETKDIPVAKSGGDLRSIMGYRDDSPFRFNPYNVINSGNITMNGVSTPLLAINNGNVHYLPPNSGNYKFKGKRTTEIPLFQMGGQSTINELELAKKRGLLEEFQNTVPINNYAATAAPDKINPILSTTPTITQPTGDIKTQTVPSSVPSPKPQDTGLGLALSTQNVPDLTFKNPFSQPVQGPQSTINEQNRINTITNGLKDTSNQLDTDTGNSVGQGLAGVGMGLLKSIVPIQQTLLGVSRMYDQQKRQKLAMQRMADQDFNPTFQFVENDYGSIYKSGGTLKPSKAKKMLDEGIANGHVLTEKQKKYFHAIEHGWKPKHQDGGDFTETNEFDAYDFLFGDDDIQTQQAAIQEDEQLAPEEISNNLIANPIDDTDTQDLALQLANEQISLNTFDEPIVIPEESSIPAVDYSITDKKSAPKNTLDFGIKLRNYAMSLGLSKAEASGLIGNAYGESDLRPTLKGTADTKGSVGLFQPHSERLTALKKYATSQGKDWTDPYVQVEQAVRELNTTHKKARGNFSTGTDAARAIMNHFEKPAEWAKKQSFGKRAGFAEQLMQYKSGGII